MTYSLGVRVMENAAAGPVAGELRRVERVYAVLAKVYDASFDWALGPGRRIAVRALGVRSGDRVLEIGVGTGLSFPLYPADCHVTGIDISEEMLERAKARRDRVGPRQADLRLMDAGQLEFEDESFDRVLAPYVISVVPDPVAVMREACRVCRVGGRVVVVNHFRSERLFLAALERACSPASQWLGFRLDLPASVVRRTPGLRLTREDRVNLLGLWRLMEFERSA